MSWDLYLFFKSNQLIDYNDFFLNLDTKYLFSWGAIKWQCQRHSARWAMPSSITDISWYSLQLNTKLFLQYFLFLFGYVPRLATNRLYCCGFSSLEPSGRCLPSTATRKHLMKKNTTYKETLFHSDHKYLTITYHIIVDTRFFLVCMWG